MAFRLILAIARVISSRDIYDLWFSPPGISSSYHPLKPTVRECNFEWKKNVLKHFKLRVESWRRYIGLEWCPGCGARYERGDQKQEQTYFHMKNWRCEDNRKTLISWILMLPFFLIFPFTQPSLLVSPPCQPWSSQPHALIPVPATFFANFKLKIFFHHSLPRTSFGSPACSILEGNEKNVNLIVIYWYSMC